MYIIFDSELHFFLPVYNIFMKHNRKKLILLGILIILVGAIITLFNSQTNYLFSRAVDTVVNRGDGPDPRPAVESIDVVSSDNDQQQDIPGMIQSLQQELL